MKVIFALEGGKYVKEFTTLDIVPTINDVIKLDKSIKRYIVKEILIDYPYDIYYCFVGLK